MAKGITAQEMDSATASGLVPHLGTTTNSGNSYSVTSNMPISTNQKFTIKFNVASSTAPTLKINNDTALPIKNANGNNAKLYASVYTLFRDGSAFILQGEGGEYGTAQAVHVLSPQTFGTEDGVKQGAMPNRGAGGTVTPGTVNQTKDAGYYSSAITILGDADLKPENIRNGINVFNVPGTLRPSGFSHTTFTGTENQGRVDSGTVEVRHLLSMPSDSYLGVYTPQYTSTASNGGIEVKCYGTSQPKQVQLCLMDYQGNYKVLSSDQESTGQADLYMFNVIINRETREVSYIIPSYNSSILTVKFSSNIDVSRSLSLVVRFDYSSLPPNQGWADIKWKVSGTFTTA